MGGKTSTSGQGRPKGIPNKSTVAVKTALQAVYADLQETPVEGAEPGPHAHFKFWASNNPTEFYKLWVKMLPAKTEVTGEDGAPIASHQTVDVSSLSEDQIRALASIKLPADA